MTAELITSDSSHVTKICQSHNSNCHSPDSKQSLERLGLGDRERVLTKVGGQFACVKGDSEGKDAPAGRRREECR